uniref:Pentatricopeptide repeat-containing protein At4g21300 family n=1 Tax=Cajanus cajan TaxID=3821 RepID=A0A151RAA4_CAJCA|nr:Pentatricopeptide repeat-containing protein At4g21300 family [Cajanus cajan]
MHTATNICNNVISKSHFSPQGTQDSLTTQLESMFQACSDASMLQQVRQVHTQVIVGGMSDICTLSSNILGLYVLCGRIKDAGNLFFRLELCYALPWNKMIRGFFMLGWFDFALLFYFKMLGSQVSPDKYTFPYVIKACGGLKNVSLCMVVHNMIRYMGFHMDLFVGSALIKLYADNGYINDARLVFDELPQRDNILWNVMLNGYVKFAMYSKCGNLFDARKLFNIMPQTDTVTWNGLIAGYVQNGFTDEAAPLFNAMISVGVKPDSVTFASFLPSILKSGSLKHCKEVHSYIVRHRIPFDVYLKSALIDIYFKGGDVKMARKIFQQNTLVDVAVCTAMISGYVLNGLNIDAINIFRWLIQEGMVPNSLTMASVLPACAALAALKLGKELHCDILKKQLGSVVNVGSAITDMYAKCGRLDLAYEFFKRMSERDSVCWNSMISSFSQNGKPEMAIDLFHQMGMSGAKFDSVSLSSALSAAANSSALYYGKEMHGYVIRNAFSCDTFVASALIDMYSKCGKLALARIRPDHVTFLVIISACGHAGLVDEGTHYFRCMTGEYGICARMEHYASMVDLYGRAGRLHEAFDTIKSMPFTPDAGVWGTLLGACRLHGNVELAKLASTHLLELDPKNSGYYVLLSNVHADAGEWASVLKVRSLMKENRVQKIPGYSWIDVNGGTHMFCAADGNHPESVEIYLILKSLLLELRKQGYVPQPYLPLHPQIMGKN